MDVKLRFHEKKPMVGLERGIKVRNNFNNKWEDQREFSPLTQPKK